MAFDFVRPVYAGEPVTCTVTVESVAGGEERYELAASVTCENEADEVVMRGTMEGTVRPRFPGAIGSRVGTPPARPSS